MDACTMVGVAEVRALRSTVQQLTRRHPDVQLCVLDIESALEPQPGLRLLTPADIGVDDDEVHSAAILGGARGLRAWLLPRLLRHLVREGTTVVYVGAGVVPLGDLSRLLESARTHGLSLVERRTARFPADGLSPDQPALRVAGRFHDVLLAAGPRALPFLDDWASIEPATEDDLPTPPPWQALVTGTPHEVLESDVILSRWNVDPSSTIAQVVDAAGAATTWTLDGAPCLAADLTTFDPDRPWLFSTTDQSTTRTRLSEHAALRSLCREYGPEPADAARSTDPAAGPRYGLTADGLPVRAPVRRAYREALVAFRAGRGAQPPDPYDSSEPARFTEWLDEIVSDDGVPLTRYLRAVYDVRPDLQRQFPEVPGRDADLFVHWAELHARHEGDYSDRLVRSASRAARHGEEPPRYPPPPRHPPRRPRGTNVVGYLNGELGIGESARLMLAALRTTREKFATVAVDRHLQSRQRADMPTSAGAHQLFDTTLLCVNADQTGAVLAAEPDAANTGHRIGMWYWETESFPASMHGAFGQVDEIWVATDFVRDAIGAHTRLPVVTVTPPLGRPAAPTDLTRADLGLPEGRPVLLFVFDYLSTAERKNPVGLVEAFRRAFSRDEGPVLVLKSINADKRVGDAERVRLVAADEPDILLLEDYLSPAGRDALLQHCDVYVSLHRSEGLGLTMAEAMALGKPVIATAYSGNLQFMTRANSFLVPWKPIEVPPHCEPYAVGTRWADPDLDVAARMMRQVIEQPGLAASRGARAARDIRTRHSPRRAGRRIARLLRARRLRREQRLVGARVNRQIRRVGIRVRRLLRGGAH